MIATPSIAKQFSNALEAEIKWCLPQTSLTESGTERDFAPVMLIGMISNILVANINLPAKTMAELVALAKSKPGVITIASSGYGSSPHLCAELLKDFAGIDLTHVPYKGSAPAISDLQGGQIDLFFDNSPGVLPYIKSGALRALAVTGSKRLPALPNVPTLQQSG